MDKGINKKQLNEFLIHLDKNIFYFNVSKKNKIYYFINLCGTLNDLLKFDKSKIFNNTEEVKGIVSEMSYIIKEFFDELIKELDNNQNLPSIAKICLDKLKSTDSKILEKYVNVYSFIEKNYPEILDSDIIKNLNANIANSCIEKVNKLKYYIKSNIDNLYLISFMLMEESKIIYKLLTMGTLTEERFLLTKKSLFLSLEKKYKINYLQNFGRLKYFEEFIDFKYNDNYINDLSEIYNKSKIHYKFLVAKYMFEKICILDNFYNNDFSRNQYLYHVKNFLEMSKKVVSYYREFYLKNFYEIKSFNNFHKVLSELINRYNNFREINCDKSEKLKKILCLKKELEDTSENCDKKLELSNLINNIFSDKGNYFKFLENIEKGGFNNDITKKLKEIIALKYYTFFDYIYENGKDFKDLILYFSSINLEIMRNIYKTLNPFGAVIVKDGLEVMMRNIYSLLNTSKIEINELESLSDEYLKMNDISMIKRSEEYINYFDSKIKYINSLKYSKDLNTDKIKYIDSLKSSENFYDVLENYFKLMENNEDAYEYSYRYSFKNFKFLNSDEINSIALSSLSSLNFYLFRDSKYSMIKYNQFLGKLLNDNFVKNNISLEEDSQNHINEKTFGDFFMEPLQDNSIEKNISILGEVIGNISELNEANFILRYRKIRVVLSELEDFFKKNINDKYHNSKIIDLKNSFNTMIAVKNNELKEAFEKYDSNDIVSSKELKSLMTNIKKFNEENKDLFSSYKSKYVYDPKHEVGFLIGYDEGFTKGYDDGLIKAYRDFCEKFNKKESIEYKTLSDKLSCANSDIEKLFQQERNIK